MYMTEPIPSKCQTIRRAKSADMPTISDLWLQTSLQAHSFVADEYWRAEYDTMCHEYFPECEVWLLEESGHLLAFVALHGDELSALFVTASRQRQCLGEQLVRFAQRRRSYLELSVYAKNPRALAFYRKMGFVPMCLGACVNTDEAEWHLRWSVNRP